jgi:hypothetical protein
MCDIIFTQFQIKVIVYEKEAKQKEWGKLGFEMMLLTTCFYL